MIKHMTPQRATMLDKISKKQPFLNITILQNPNSLVRFVGIGGRNLSDAMTTHSVDQTTGSLI